MVELGRGVRRLSRRSVVSYLTRVRLVSPNTLGQTPSNWGQVKSRRSLIGSQTDLYGSTDSSWPTLVGAASARTRPDHRTAHGSVPSTRSAPEAAKPSHQRSRGAGPGTSWHRTAESSRATLRRDEDVRRQGMRQTLQGSFSAVSKRNFARKYAFESSRRDLHNALLCTALKSHFSLQKC